MWERKWTVCRDSPDDIKAITCSHEAEALGAAECLLSGWRPDFSFGSQLKSLKMTNGIAPERPATCRPSREVHLRSSGLWLHGFLRADVGHLTQSSACNQETGRKQSSSPRENTQYCTGLIKKFGLFQYKLCSRSWFHFTSMLVSLNEKRPYAFNTGYYYRGFCLFCPSVTLRQFHNCLNVSQVTLKALL